VVAKAELAQSYRAHPQVAFRIASINVSPRSVQIGFRCQVSANSLRRASPLLVRKIEFKLRFHSSLSAICSLTPESHNLNEYKI
jgi:hypothetical protein